MNTEQLSQEQEPRLATLVAYDCWSLLGQLFGVHGNLLCSPSTLAPRPCRGQSVRSRGAGTFVPLARARVGP